MQDTREDLLRRHREVSETIRRAMLALLTFALFCWLTLGSPDRLLIVGDETIKVPFVEVDLSFPAFLFVAPFLLIVLTVYLHVFYEERLQLEKRLRQTVVLRSYDPEAIPGYREQLINDDAGRAAMLFNFDHHAARRLTGFIFYMLVPLTLAAITWKALAQIAWGVPMMTVLATVTIGLAYVRHMRLPNRRWSARTVRCIYGTLAVALLFVILQGSHQQRPLNLYRAELPEAWLLGANLRFADLADANLQGANLQGVNLSEADLRRANLDSAKLIGADLREAYLHSADLREADLSHAKLTSANFHNADLTNAVFRADLSGVRVLEDYLPGADFSDIGPIDAKFCRTQMPDETICNRDCFDGDKSCFWIENRRARIEKQKRPKAK